MEGYGDPFNRGCYPWGQEDRELLAWYHRLGMVRRACPALADGEFEPVWSEGGIDAFALGIYSVNPDAKIGRAHV